MLNLDGINNIIFDLGDVIINIKPENTIRAFQDLLQQNFKDLEQDLAENQIIEQVETGEYPIEKLIAHIKSYNAELITQDIIQAWNSMLLDIPQERLTLIRQLAKQYRLFLLSNTNELHLEYIDNYVVNNFSMTCMADPFEKAYYSHLIKMRKPNPKIFTSILEENNLLPHETLFIDDSEEHIISAKQLNLKTHHLLENETIIDIFS